MHMKDYDLQMVVSIIWSKYCDHIFDPSMDK